MLSRRIERASDDVELAPVIDRETLLAMQAAVEGVHVATSVREYCVDLVTATRDSQSAAVGASPRGSLALLKLSRCRAALQRPRLRPSRRRQGHRRPGARASPRAPPRAVGAADHRRGRRARRARERPDPSRGGRPAERALVRRAGNPRLLGYAALAAIGMVGALALRRPELAIVAGPFALVLVAGRAAATRASRPSSLSTPSGRSRGARSRRRDRPRPAGSGSRRADARASAGMEVVDGGATRSLRLRAGEERGSSSSFGARPGASTSRETSVCAPATPSGS